MYAKSALVRGGVAVLVAISLSGCSGNESSRTNAPVELVVTNTQTLQTLDIAPGAANCAASIGTIQLQSILKNPATISSQTFNEIRVTSYQVSYQRRDGGTAVPASFTRALDTLLQPGATAPVTNFLVLTSDALLQAPFASLLPQNGGRDPVTGRPFVQLDVIVQVFGQTLAGEAVTGSTRFTLDFCYNCGGCH